MTAPLPLPLEPRPEAKAELRAMLALIEKMGVEHFLAVLGDLVFLGLVPTQGGGLTLTVDEPL